MKIAASIVVVLCAGCGEPNVPRPLPHADPSAALAPSGSAASAAPTVSEVAPKNYGELVESWLATPPPKDACLLRPPTRAQHAAIMAAPHSALPKHLHLGALPSTYAVPRIMTEHGALGGAGEPSPVDVLVINRTSRSFGTAAQLLVVFADDASLMASIVFLHSSSAVRKDTSPERMREAAADVESVAFVFSAETSLERVDEVLGWFRDTKAEVAFAIIPGGPMPGEIRSADALKGALAGSTPKGACSSGLVDIPAGKKPGDLDQEQSQAAIQAVTALAQRDCGDKATDGGAVLVALRLLRDGTVEDACVEQDFVGSPELRECVVAVVKSYSYPKLSYGDFLNYAHTITFTHGDNRAVFCETSP